MQCNILHYTMSLIPTLLHNYKLSLCRVSDCWNPVFSFSDRLHSESGYMSSPERGGPRSYPAAAYPPGPGYEDPYYSQYASRSGSITPVIDEEARWVHRMLQQVIVDMMLLTLGIVSTWITSCCHGFILWLAHSCLLLNVSIFCGWHETTWHTEIHIKQPFCQ
jgi:hypothetical protein